MAYAVDAHFALNQPQACAVGSSQAYLLLILIHTTIDNYDRREAGRDTWITNKASDSSVVILYSINEYVDHTESSKHKLLTLQRENEIYHDIIFSNFSHTDRFSSVLIPSTVWITKFCPHASHVLSIFDNSVVDLTKLVPFLTMHSKSRPALICDYLMPHEETIYDLASIGKGVCSYKSFLTTPSIMKELASVIMNNENSLKDTWLSEICSFASIPIETNKRLFTGSRTKPSLLKELMDANYPDSDIMIANVRSPVPGKESILMQQVWLLIEAHHDKVREQDRVPIDSTESGSIVTLAAVLMLIDFSVIFFIFTLIFCKRRLKWFWW